MGKLTERQDLVLKMVVEEHLSSSEPVGSRFISKAMGLSPATIRNIMSDLEEMCYISSPHISAGRLPTDEGFRYYVDNCISLTSESVGSAIAVLESLLNLEDKSVNTLLEHATKQMANLTHATCFVAAPKLQEMALQSIKFLPVQGSTVLAVIVTKSGYIHNTIFNMDKRIKMSLLDDVAGFLNENFANRTLLEIRDSLEAEIIKGEGVLHELGEALQLVQQGLSSSNIYIDGDGDSSGELIISGRENMFSQPEFNNPEKLTAFFTSIAQKYITKHIIDQCIHSDGVQIFIGNEVIKGLEPKAEVVEILKEYGVIIKGYGGDGHGKNLGFVGVVGPKRMDYAAIVPILNITSQLITQALNKEDNNDNNDNNDNKPMEE